jgi:hypothetical protein
MLELVREYMEAPVSWSSRRKWVVFSQAESTMKTYRLKKSNL